MVINCVHMDLFGWLRLVVLCSWWLRASAADGMGRKILTELHGVSPILMEMGCWDIILCIWAIFAIFSILAISMARSKNTGKGKAPSYSMERTVKKRKADTSQTEKGNGKIPHLRARRHLRAKMKRLKPCLLSLQNQSGKSGANQLQGGVSIVSE